MLVFEFPYEMPDPNLLWIGSAVLFLKSRANGINDVEQLFKLCFPDPAGKADAFWSQDFWLFVGSYYPKRVCFDVCVCVQKSLFSAIWSSCWLDSLQHSCALTPVHFCCGWPWFAMILRWYSETVFNKLYRQYNPSRLPLSGELMY